MRFREGRPKASVLDRGGKAWTSHDKFNHAQILMQVKNQYIYMTSFSLEFANKVKTCTMESLNEKLEFGILT